MVKTQWTTAELNRAAAEEREEERRANSTFYAILLREPNSTTIHQKIFQDIHKANAEAERLEKDLIYHAEMAGASTWGVYARVCEVNLA